VKVLVTGAEGMLARTMMRRLSDQELLGIDLDECDITRAADVDRVVGEFGPDAIVHCAAMTAVDECESNSDQAFAVNAVGSANIAAAAYRCGARLVAISTDYVFSGELDRPYHEFDQTGPRSVYGASKLAGEQAVRRHCPDHIIARIAWLYGPGGPSFLHTMCRLGREGGEALRVVDDQIGNPTSTDVVAEGVTALLATPIVGTVHLTCEGEATWCDFTREIFRLAGIGREVAPCTTAEFPRPAPRPANSRLENAMLRLSGLAPTAHWKDALAAFFKEHPDG